MPRPPRPWFRFYSESLENRKLQSLPDPLFRCYVNLLCLANRNVPRGALPPVADVAYHLRLEVSVAGDALTELRRRGFLEGNRTSYRVHDWQEWQPDSDANGTPGRRDRNVKRTGKERAIPAERTRSERIDIEEEKEEEGEQEGEEEKNARAPSHPFVLAYAQNYQRRNAGRPPPPTQHAEAVALENEHGSDWCFRAAEAFDWSKQPSYLRPWIIDHKQKSNGAVAAPAPVKSLRYES